MKEIKFERKYFIKNLFKPKQVINKFDIIEFESFETLYECVKNDLFYFEKDKEIIIPIKQNSDYDNLKKIINGTNIHSISNICLFVNKQEIYDYILSNILNKKFSIIISKDIDINTKKYWKTNAKDWISKNRIITLIKIDYEHFEEQISEIISIYNERYNRFFFLDFDYVSFNNMKIKEFKKIKTWLNHIKIWMKEKKIKINKLEIISNNKFHRKIFVSNDLKIYINRKKIDSWSFDLKKNLNKDGESINTIELNVFRSYLDLTPQVLQQDFSIVNWSLIDYSQCKKITGNLNEIPLIMSLIQKCLYDF